MQKGSRQKQVASAKAPAATTWAWMRTIEKASAVEEGAGNKGENGEDQIMQGFQ